MRPVFFGASVGLLSACFSEPPVIPDEQTSGAATEPTAMSSSEAEESSEAGEASGATSVAPPGESGDPGPRAISLYELACTEATWSGSGSTKAGDVIPCLPEMSPPPFVDAREPIDGAFGPEPRGLILAHTPGMGGEILGTFELDLSDFDAPLFTLIAECNPMSLDGCSFHISVELWEPQEQLLTTEGPFVLGNDDALGIEVDIDLPSIADLELTLVVSDGGGGDIPPNGRHAIIIDPVVVDE